jgi:hypothetical protein
MNRQECKRIQKKRMEKGEGPQKTRKKKSYIGKRERYH